MVCPGTGPRRRAGLRALVAAVLSVLMPVFGAGAQTNPSSAPVLVLSGEHEGFSRLAMVLPGPGGWRLEPVPGGHALRFEDPGLTLDPSRIHDLIPRDRLESVALLPDGMFLGISCDCYLRSFEDRPGVLVIDIVSGPDPDATAPRARPRPRPAPEATESGTATVADAAFGLEGGTVPEAAAPRPEINARTAGDDGPAAQAAGSDPDAVAPPEGLGAARSWLVRDGRDVALQTPPDGHDPARDAARAALVAQISRAATQGVVDLAAPPQSAPPQSAPPQSAPPLSGKEAGEGALAPDQDDGHPPLGLAVATAIDRDLAAEAGALLTAQGDPCIADDRLALAAWGGTGSPWEGLSRARRDLLAEFDQPQEEALLALVRGYLHMGFGAEAMATLAAFPEAGVPDRELLVALGRLIDDLPGPPGLFAAMADCDGAAALWAVLAAPDDLRGDAVNGGAVVRAFSALPPHLRGAVGGRLAARLVAAGRQDAARSIASALARGAGAPAAEAELIEAHLLSLEDPAMAAPRLAELARGNSPRAVEAMILLVEARLARGEPVAPNMIDLIASRSFELRGTPTGARLQMAHALALASAGDFTPAFAIAHDVQEAASEDAAATLRNAFLFPLLQMLVADGDDATFLRHALELPLWQSAAAPASLRLDIARRLIDLGLAEEALAALPDRARLPVEERRLRGEALLRAGQPAAALPLLAESGDDQLRGAALAALGNPAAAVAALRAAGEEEAARAVAWRSGDAALIAAHGTPLQRRLSGEPTSGPQAPAPATVAPPPDGPVPNDLTQNDLAQNDLARNDLAGNDLAGNDPVPTASGSAAAAHDRGPLARARALLDDSAGLRADIDAALAEMPRP